MCIWYENNFYSILSRYYLIRHLLLNVVELEYVRGFIEVLADRVVKSQRGVPITFQGTAEHPLHFIQLAFK